MRFIRDLLISSLILFLVSCASTTIIKANVPHAAVYVDNHYVGQAPVAYSDIKVAGSSSVVRIEASGYKPLTATIKRTEEVNPAALAGTILILVPVLWITDYRKSYSFELKPLAESEQNDEYHLLKALAQSSDSNS